MANLKHFLAALTLAALALCAACGSSSIPAAPDSGGDAEVDTNPAEVQLGERLFLETVSRSSSPPTRPGSTRRWRAAIRS